MTTGDEIFRRPQTAARSTAARSGGAPPTQEYLIRHLLESFLNRLTHTTHATEFVLKGGILLAAYGVRRPTKDADANGIGINLTADDLTDVVGAIAAVDLPDGVSFDMDSMTIQQIREQASYAGLRVRINAIIGPWKGTAVWDVSIGDPIVPAPRIVTIERVLGEPIALLGYAPETTLAVLGSWIGYCELRSTVGSWTFTCRGETPPGPLLGRHS